MRILIVYGSLTALHCAIMDRQNPDVHLNGKTMACSVGPHSYRAYSMVSPEDFIEGVLIERPSDLDRLRGRVGIDAVIEDRSFDFGPAVIGWPEFFQTGVVADLWAGWNAWLRTNVLR